MPASLTVNAGTGVNDNSVGALSWSDLNRISIQDAVTAYTLSTTADQISNRNRIPFTGLSSIPVGAVVTGIGVMVRWGVFSIFGRGATNTQVQLLIGDVLVGNNKGGAVTIVGTNPIVFQNNTHGGAGDMWGTSGVITRASLLAATNLLAIYYTYSSGAGSTYAEVDHVTLTVHYIVAPTAFLLLTPTTGSTEVSVTPSLTWAASVDVATYTVEIATDAGFSSIVYTEAGLVTESHTVDTPLAEGTLYYWRVTAINAAGSTVATAFTFTTVAPPSSGGGPSKAPTLGVYAMMALNLLDDDSPSD